MKYIAFTCPEYQAFMTEPWFREESYYDPEKNVYLIPEHRVDENRIDEFEIAFNHKVGDKVTIKSLSWYDSNKDYKGYIICKTTTFVDSMAKYCGKTATITGMRYDHYILDIDNEYWDWDDDMFED